MIIPSRKATRKYLKGKESMKGLDLEEKDLLESYEISRFVEQRLTRRLNRPGTFAPLYELLAG